jgi:hypothetical protein
LKVRFIFISFSLSIADQEARKDLGEAYRKH